MTTDQAHRVFSFLRCVASVLMEVVRVVLIFLMVGLSVVVLPVVVGAATHMLAILFHMGWDSFRV